MRIVITGATGFIGSNLAKLFLKKGAEAACWRPVWMGTLLDRLGIAVRTGHHCAEPLMHRLGIEGTVRASFAMYNTKEEIDELVAGIERVSKMF